MNGDDWIGAEEAGRILRVSSRMVYRYGEGADAKVRTMRAGRRILFNRVDVLAYAEELGAENRPESQTDIIRADELMRVIGAQQAELVEKAETIGQLQARLEMRITPEEERALRERIHELERQQDRLQWEVEQLRTQGTVQPVQGAPERPWWRRLLGM
ncbi:MAG TPA: hypothetical protein VLA19_26755 [Herpetosiphonaceae bacterium]|nr:hypothetical protein [Herpetosiphonaceae bacterium]